MALARICVDWAPYGEWERASEVNTGDYRYHQYEYRAQDSQYDYWD